MLDEVGTPWSENGAAVHYIGWLDTVGREGNVCLYTKLVH